MSKIYVVGIGYKPLGKRAADLVLNSKTILASSRLFDVFKRYEEYEAVREKVVVINNIDETISFLKTSCMNDETAPVTLLASGDPMFFGIGRRVTEEIGVDMVEIIPDLSSVQLAFSRIKKPWDDALLISLHGGPVPGRRRKLEYGLYDLPALLLKHGKIAVLTDKVNNPAEIARTFLNTESISGDSSNEIRLFVCEKMGYPDEHITDGYASEIAAGSFSDPNVVIIMRSGNVLDHESASVPGHDGEGFGLTEDEIIHSRGLITKDDVRAVTLHNLRLPPTGALWDIGAGSGSVSVEAALIRPGMKVFAVEKDEEQIKNIHENIKRFRVPNISVLHGAAPEVLGGLPAPSRVFIGGSGGRIGEIIEVIGSRMESGIIVINAATVETFSVAAEALKKAGYAVSVSQVSVSRMKALGENHFFAAQNPVFVIKGQRQA
ncbi:MAG TPA: precorrin-6y C5,15-methyltransferase (decarboxylating) subunit CbiE [Dissulfurispiraceae bacterium]|nr:precorrin-6y C5,15-methyltransferase (decarboxylating) subunit CbiE [Dissulfurispiraceae bacterium]